MEVDISVVQHLYSCIFSFLFWLNLSLFQLTCTFYLPTLFLGHIVLVFVIFTPCRQQLEHAHCVLYMCTVLVFCTHALYIYMYYQICMCMLLQFAASVNTSRFFLQYFISLFLYNCSSRPLSAFDRCLKSTQMKRTLFLMGQCNMCLLQLPLSLCCCCCHCLTFCSRSKVTSMQSVVDKVRYLLIQPV